jgi:transposase
MLFAVLEVYHSLREVVIGFLSNAHKLSHLGLSYLVSRSTLSDANARRGSAVFEEIYMDVYRRHHSSLADSKLNTKELKRLYAMDSTTITLFKSILKGCGRQPKEGKKKGGIKAHTIISLEDNMPCFVRYTEAVRHDHILLGEVRLPKGSILVFDKGYVDYEQYERFTKDGIFYVTRLKDNALYECGEEYDIPDDADSGVLKDEEITLLYGEKGKMKHRCRRIAYWDNHNKRVFIFISNNFELSAEQIALIYKKRWQIELLFKQLKQSFPLKYFLGDNQNAIEIQIWMAMLAYLLISLVQSKVKRKWAYSNMVSVIRQQLMNYINIYAFLEDPEGCWKKIIKKNQAKYENSLFPDLMGAYF